MFILTVNMHVPQLSGINFDVDDDVNNKSSNVLGKFKCTCFHTT